MAVESLAGTKLGISASAPATFNAAGYAALTFANIGEITDPGEHGRTYALITHMPIDKRNTQKFKGSFNEGQMTLQLAVNTDDAGQAILQAAKVSDASYYFAMTYQGGDIHYFPAKVMSFIYAGGGVDTIRAGSVQLELTSDASGVGIIEVEAP